MNKELPQIGKMTKLRALSWCNRAL